MSDGGFGVSGLSSVAGDNRIPESIMPDVRKMAHTLGVSPQEVVIRSFSLFSSVIKANPLGESK
jgi:hypothetical protein